MKILYFNILFLIAFAFSVFAQPNSIQSELTKKDFWDIAQIIANISTAVIAIFALFFGYIQWRKKLEFDRPRISLTDTPPHFKSNNKNKKNEGKVNIEIKNIGKRPAILLKMKLYAIDSNLDKEPAIEEYILPNVFQPGSKLNISAFNIPDISQIPTHLIITIFSYRDDLLKREFTTSEFLRLNRYTENNPSVTLPYMSIDDKNNLLEFLKSRKINITE